MWEDLSHNLSVVLTLWLGCPHVLPHSILWLSCGHPLFPDDQSTCLCLGDWSRSLVRLYTPRVFLHWWHAGAAAVCSCGSCKPPCLWNKLLTLDRRCRHQSGGDSWGKQVAKGSLKLLYSLVLHLGHPKVSTWVTCCPTGPVDTSQMSLCGASPS